MSTVQLHGSKIFDSQIKIHTGNQKYDVSLARKFQQHLTNNYRKYGAIDKGKCKKRCMEIKWTGRHYHVQGNADVELKNVKLYCNKNQFP